MIMRLLTFATFLGLIAAWETDDRCFRRRERRLRGQIDNAPSQELKLGWAPAKAASEHLIASKLQSTNLVFHLKMYWEQGFCWQEEWRERAWCFDCNGQDCNQNDLLSTQDCAETAMQEFIWIPQGNDDGRGSLKVANRNLCFERVSNQEYRLQICDGKDRQMFVGFTYVGPFELHPLHFPEICLSQHHDPKPDEKIYGVSCSDARKDNTHKWEVWWVKEVTGIAEEHFPELTSEGTWCTPDNPCGSCVGDCDVNADCADGLECFQRISSENPWDPIPGCSGTGRKRIDYCYNPEAPSRDDESYKLITLGKDCTSDTPCDKCFGNCGNNDHCIGNLKCYERTFKDNPWEGVPGCYSLGWQAYNYCYDTEATLAPTPGEAFAPSVRDKIPSSSPNSLMPVVPDPTPEPTTAATIATVTPEPITAAPLAVHIVTTEPSTEAPIAAVTPAPASAAPITGVTPEPSTDAPITAATPDPETEAHLATVSPEPTPAASNTTVTPEPSTETPVTAATLDPATEAPITAVTLEPSTYAPIVAVSPEPTTVAPHTAVTPSPSTKAPVLAVTPELTTSSPITEVTLEPTTAA